MRNYCNEVKLSYEISCWPKRKVCSKSNKNYKKGLVTVMLLICMQSFCYLSHKYEKVCIILCFRTIQPVLGQCSLSLTISMSENCKISGSIDLKWVNNCVLFRFICNTSRFHFYDFEILEHLLYKIEFKTETITQILSYNIKELLSSIIVCGCEIMLQNNQGEKTFHSGLILSSNIKAVRLYYGFPSKKSDSHHHCLLSGKKSEPVLVAVWR